MTARLNTLGVKIFADGADCSRVRDLCLEPWIKGFTTNPTLMRAAGVAHYRTFAEELLELVSDRPISFEVIADDLDEIERQAREIATWGENVFVKVPVTNTRREPMSRVARSLAGDGIKVNVTAVMTVKQVEQAASWLAEGPAGFVSVFAGRVADTGRDPVPIMTAALEEMAQYPHLELIWASPRELLNVVQADAIGCHVITVTDAILERLPGLGRDLDEFSLDTVRMFRCDAEAAGYALETRDDARPRSAA